MKRIGKAILALLAAAGVYAFGYFVLSIALGLIVGVIGASGWVSEDFVRAVQDLGSPPPLALSVAQGVIAVGMLVPFYFFLKWLWNRWNSGS